MSEELATAVNSQAPSRPDTIVGDQSQLGPGEPEKAQSSSLEKTASKLDLANPEETVADGAATPIPDEERYLTGMKLFLVFV